MQLICCLVAEPNRKQHLWTWESVLFLLTRMPTVWKLLAALQHLCDEGASAVSKIMLVSCKSLQLHSFLNHFLDWTAPAFTLHKKYLHWWATERTALNLLTHLIVHKLQGKGRLPHASTAHHDHLVQCQGALVFTFTGSHRWILLSVSFTHSHTCAHTPTHTRLCAQALSDTTCEWQK